VKRYEFLLALGQSRKPARKYHRHRIVPGYQGGKYIASNIAYLTRAEHIEVHRLRFALFGNYRDLLACKLLGEKLSDEEWKLCARNGGAVTGKMHAKNRTGVCGRSKEQMSCDGKKSSAAISKETRSRGGKTTGNWLKANRLGIFGIPPQQDYLNRAKGGRIQGARISYHDRTKGMLATRWATDGERHLRLKSTDIIPQGFRLGRATPWQTR
jgi:hypothetical protein